MQKLKWYCSLCKHQCNDANGFRAHIQSESHRMLMAQARPNIDSVLKNNSQQFEAQFLSVLKSQYGNKEIAANRVYVQVIKDRSHTHMSSTRWESVKGFCFSLQKKNLISMRMTDRGPFIKYIGKDSVEEIEKQERNLLMLNMELEKMEIEKAEKAFFVDIPELFEIPIEEVKSVDIDLKKEEKKDIPKAAAIFSMGPKKKQ